MIHIIVMAGLVLIKSGHDELGGTMHHLNDSQH
jgi:hypothetical protein